MSCATRQIIRVQDPKGGPAELYLEISDESGLKGYAGPLMKEQAAALPANFRELLAGRDAANPAKLNFATLWAECHPGKCVGKLRGGERPADRRRGVGLQRTLRHTETGYVITALSAIDLALWDLRGKAAAAPSGAAGGRAPPA